MKIAIVGCGYVADFYIETLPNHPILELVAACDTNPDRRAAFSSRYAVQMYESVNELLALSDAELVLNLTDPHSHYAVSEAILKAGRHVYAEKPLAMKFDMALELVELAKSRGLSISGAPCNVHSESVESVRRALAAGEAGTIRAVFAEMSEGRPDLAGVRKWRSASGAPWPYVDEFKLGSTIQHAGYCINLLVDLFGPVHRVHSVGAVCCPYAQVDLQLKTMGADLTVSVLEFCSGIIARVTCDRVATRIDRSMHFIGDKGTLTIEDIWHYDAPAYFTPINSNGTTLWEKFRRRLDRVISSTAQRILPGKHWHGSRLAVPRTKGHLTEYARMDFARGPAFQAQAISAGREPVISAELVLHTTEVALAMQYPDKFPSPYSPRSTLLHWTGREEIAPYLPKLEPPASSIECFA